MQRALITAGAWLFILVSTAPQLASAPLHADRKSYKTDAGGLRKLIQDLAGSANRGDLAAFAELYIPNHANWFRDAFGESVGTMMAPIYEADKADMPGVLAKALASAGRNGKVKVEVNYFRLGGSAEALKTTMSNQVAIFTVVLNPDDESRLNLGVFTVVDKQFRYVGRIYVLAPSSPENKVRLLLTKPTDVIQDPWLVEQPPPRYPRVLRAMGIQGSAKVSGYIAEDGNVTNLTAIEGRSEFAEATLEAVRRWRYKPLLHNGVYLRSLVVVQITYSLSSSPRFP